MTTAPKPFASDNYWYNEDRAARKGLRACCLCGKGTKTPKAWVAVTDGGAAIGHIDTPEDEPGHMGFFVIGSSCYRKHRATFKALGYERDGKPFTFED